MRLMHDKFFKLKKSIGHYSAVKLAPKYSLFNLAIFAIDISLGQVASQAPVLVHDPKPSLSICATMLNTLVFEVIRQDEKPLHLKITSQNYFYMRQHKRHIQYTLQQQRHHLLLLFQWEGYCHLLRFQYLH